MTDVLLYWRPDLRDDDIPNTGSLEGDFKVIVERSARTDHELISNDLVLRVAMEAAHDPELASALDELMVFKGRRVVTAILGQAVQRGEVADRDWSLVADVMTAMGLMRVITGLTVDAGFLRQVIDTCLLYTSDAADE